MQEDEVVTQRIPVDVHPEMAFFSIVEGDFESDARWRGLVDLLARHGMYNLVTVTMRIAGHPIDEPETHDLFARLVAHARERGLEVAVDLDPRLARGEFKRRHPDEQQRIVYVERCALRDDAAEFRVEPEEWNDHMTGNGTPYRVEGGRCVGAVAWRVNKRGEVVAGSRRDVSAAVSVESAGADGVAGRVEGVSEADEVAVLVEFELFTPDVFSAHVVAYQRELVEAYADLPLKGVVKDEWGFPPTRPSITEHRAFWYSTGYDEAYQAISDGRELLEDLVLMAVPEEGREEERLTAINRYMTLNLRRQAEIEEDYYAAVKQTFGPEALVTKHATWYPRINAMEVFKNGLSWWVARRDIAQTDEVTPLSAALGMAKKFGSACWLNEGYAHRPELYRRNIWRYAAAGGRMVFHSLYPTINGRPRDPADAHHSTHSLLLTEELIRAECRVRLLNLISSAPLDCPVAFVFGHERVMNWAGEGYLDYGEDLSLDLWRQGYAADLYPSSELAGGAFEVSADGWVQVGCQRYEVVVLYEPDLCGPEVAALFEGAPPLRTALAVVGEWGRDDRGRAFDGLAALGDGVERLSSGDAALPWIAGELERRGAVRQPPLEEPYLLFNNDQIGMPAPRGTARLVDGTVVRLEATAQSDGGDPIDEVVPVGGVDLQAEAEGLFAARASGDGLVEALAAGGLRRVCGGGLDVTLDEPVDVALWRDEQGEWRGVVQGLRDGDVPAALRAITGEWQRLSVPPPYPHPGV